MHVDLMLSDASLLKQQYKHDTYAHVVQHCTNQDYGLIRAAGYMDYFDIILKHTPKEKDGFPWAFPQTEFFRFCDLVLLAACGRNWESDPITKEDIQPFRRVIAATEVSVSELLILFAIYNIDDKNSFIDNYHNTFNLTNGGMTAILKMFNDQLGVE
jgi:hypothetical protein